LRYPGGKAKLYNYIRSLIEINGLLGETYIEPFAGGSGLALKLLLKDDVKRIVINDYDPAIYAFWHCVLNSTQQMCDFVNTVPLTVDEWDRQHKIYSEQENYSELELAKAVLFLNRTNVSGIINGGVIGKRDQTGKYKMDARFNRADLIKKINAISALSDRIDLFINFDPPYVAKGGQLYKNAFSDADHEALRDQIAACRRKWVVTYDICDLVSKLYAEYRGSYIDIYYSANGARKAKEYIFFSDNLILPESIDIFNADLTNIATMVEPVGDL
jgi:DNA adenine methylase